MQGDFVYKEKKMEEEELLSLHQRSAISQTETLQGASKEELKARQDEILRRKLNTSDQYVVNRIDRMNYEARQWLDIRTRNLNRYLAENSDYELFARRAEDRMMGARGKLGLGALHRTQIKKRKKKMEKKHGIHIRVNRIRRDYLDTRKHALKDHMTGVYEDILTKEGAEGATFLPEVMRDNPYFEEINDFAVWMTEEKERQSGEQKDQAERDMYFLLHHANRFEGEHQNGNPNKPVVTADRQKMLSIYEKHVMDVKLEDFDYHSREEFLDKLKREYPKLKALAGAGKVLDDLEKEGGQYEAKGETMVFRAKLETLKEIYDHYEAMRKIYDSNCYVLLARRDLVEEKLRDLEAYKARVERRERQAILPGNGQLLQYLEGLTALKRNVGFKRGSSSERIFQEKLKGLRKDADRKSRLQ